MEVLLAEDAEGLLTRTWLGTEPVTLGLYNFPWLCSKRNVSAIFLAQSVLLGNFVWYLYTRFCVGMPFLCVSVEQW